MKKTGLILFLLWITSLVLAINGGTLSFRHYTVEDGLSYNAVVTIIQDRRGFMWFGTEDGLNRFDGLTFKKYRSTGLGKKVIVSNVVSCLLEDPTGNIWVGTDAGIYILNTLTEEITPFEVTAPDGVAINSTVNKMVLDHSGCIWIGTYGQGVFCYNLKTNKLDQYNVLIEGMGSTRFDFVNQIFVDSKNTVWVAPRSAENPLLNFDRKKGGFRGLSDGSKNFSVYKFFEDSHHNLWLGTWNKGICLLNPTTGQIKSYLSPEKQGGILHIHEIVEFSPGVLFIGSDDGLSIFDTQTLEHQIFKPIESDPVSISDKFIYPIVRDREGGFWIGTYFGGVNYLSPNSGLFERYTHSRYKNSISGNVVGRFAEDKRGNIWIATDDGGLNVLNLSTGLFSAYVPKSGSNSISYHNVHALCWDDDRLWIGTYSGGLNVFDVKTSHFKYYNSNDKDLRTLDNGSIYSIFKDNENRIWVASMAGINLYNRTTDDFTRIKKLNVTTIDIEQDKNGDIWFATLGKGIYRFDTRTGKWKNYISDGSLHSLPSNQVNCISFDTAGNMWVGTTNGFCLYNPKKEIFTPINVDIPSKVICCIVPVQNDLWLTTAKGLIRYNILKKSSQIFTRSDGLMSDQFVINSAFRSSTGTIYIGTASGFNSFNPNKLKQNNFRPPVLITALEIFNKEVEVANDSPLKTAISETKEIHLSYRDNVFSLSFVALSYVTPDKNRYAYKLEGFDKDWNVVAMQHKATYTNLPAGEYVFKVKATNNDGVWNNNGTQIKIIIHPPFWKTNFFKLIYFLLFIVSLILIIRVLKHRTERLHNEEIRTLKQQKEKEIYDAKIHFFTIVAHEIRTPVSLIIGPLEKILGSAELLPKIILNDLKIIERNSQRLLQLVNQLLDFQKIEQGSLVLNMSSNNIYQLLQNIWIRFVPIFGQHNIKPVFDCPDKDIFAVVDPEAITKSVSNLLTNALKYTHDTVELSCRKTSDTTFEICVKDNGKGVPDPEKLKVFNPFYQIPGNSKQGTGIGLSLVKSIVEAHNGKIAICDCPGSGALFCLTLPIDNQATSDKPKENQDMNPVVNVDFLNKSKENDYQDHTFSKDKPVLLIVEDNDEMRNFLLDNFREECQVLSAADGTEGLAHLKKREVNLIISDLMMPGMNGLEFCKVVRSNYLYSHIPFVLLTAKTDLESKIKGLNFGADSYIEKPFSIQYLKAQINNLIENRALLRRKYSEMPFTPITTIAGNSADEQFLNKLNEIVEQNIANEEFSIDQLAEELFISRSGLFAKIKTLAGVTPNELIQLVRLKKAAEYISMREHRINEIAFLVGFNNPSYFSKCFQKQFGMTPKEFENQLK